MWRFFRDYYFRFHSTGQQFELGTCNAVCDWPNGTLGHSNAVLHDLDLELYFGRIGPSMAYSANTVDKTEIIFAKTNKETDWPVINGACEFTSLPSCHYCKWISHNDRCLTNKFLIACNKININNLSIVDASYANSAGDFESMLLRHLPKLDMIYWTCSKL